MFVTPTMALTHATGGIPTTPRIFPGGVEPIIVLWSKDWSWCFFLGRCHNITVQLVDGQGRRGLPFQFPQTRVHGAGLLTRRVNDFFVLPRMVVHIETVGVIRVDITRKGGMNIVFFRGFWRRVQFKGIVSTPGIQSPKPLRLAAAIALAQFVVGRADAFQTKDGRDNDRTNVFLFASFQIADLQLSPFHGAARGGTGFGRNGNPAKELLVR